MYLFTYEVMSRSLLSFPGRNFPGLVIVVKGSRTFELL